MYQKHEGKCKLEQSETHVRGKRKENTEKKGKWMGGENNKRLPFVFIVASSY